MRIQQLTTNRLRRSGRSELRGRPAELGVTLIELLVAMLIFAIIAVLSYRTLGSVFQTREQLQKESSKWRDAALFYSRIENDLGALLNRPIKNADNLDEPAFMLRRYPANTNEATLTFTRTGFADNDNAMAAPQRIGYRLRDGKLELLIWPGLDQAPRATPQVYTALNNVREASWRALDPRQSWQPGWRDQGEQNTDNKPVIFPLALELSITLTSGEKITRTFAIRNES